jgi:hypothetical protein
MDEKTKSVWKKSWTGWGRLRAWLIVVAATFIIVLIVILLIPGRPRDFSDWWPALAFLLFVSVVIATVFVGLWAFIRWLFCWRNFKRLLFACACFVTLIALFYAEEDWRGWHAWNQFKHEWEANKGERFDFTSVVPPPVPDDRNFAMAPIWVESMRAVLGPKNSRLWFGNQFNGRTNFGDRLEMPFVRDSSDWPTNGGGSWQKARLTDLHPWQDYYRKLAATTNLFPVASQPQSPAADVSLALSKYDSPIEELRQAGQRPYSRFPLYSNPDHPFDTLLPHLAALKGCTQVLQLRAIAELQNNQGDKALDDVKLALRLTDSIRTEPFLVSHLVRIAMVQITLQPVYESLAEHKWSDGQLVALDAELAKLNFLADYEFSMRGESVSSIASLDYIRRTRNLDYLNYSSGPKPMKRFLQILSHLAIPDSFFYQNELTIARMHQQWTLPMADLENRTISPALAHRNQIEADKELNHHWWPYKFLARMLFPAFERAVIKFAYAQSSVDLARVAIALERYRLAHGEYPDSLDALVPQFIAKVPPDVIGGQPSQGSSPASQPLHYRRTDDGQFVLYSVGWNETDDGGVVGFTKSGVMGDNRNGDWVWRYPAK